MNHTLRQIFKKAAALSVVSHLAFFPVCVEVIAQDHTEPSGENSKLVMPAMSKAQLMASENRVQFLAENKNLLQNLNPVQFPDKKITSSTDSAALAAWFSRYQNSTSGLVVSNPDDPGFSYQNGIKVYANLQAWTYDQALAGIAMLQNGNLAGAKKIFNFFYSDWQNQEGSGNFNGFWTDYNAKTGIAYEIYEYRKSMGVNAWIALFSLQYEALSLDNTEKKKSLQLATAITKWVSSLPHSNGGVAMGPNDPKGTPNFGRIYSTENNLDYYALLKTMVVLAPSASDRQLFTNELNAVKGWLKKAYDPQRGLFRRGGGLDAGGRMSWDSIQSLDVNSWALTAIGIDALTVDFGINVNDLMTNIGNNFAVQNDGNFGGALSMAKGFDFSDATNAAWLGRTGIKWVEGTNEMILNYKILGQYYANKDTAKSNYYLGLAGYFSTRNADNAISGNGTLSYTYADTFNLPIYADSANVKTFPGQAAASTGWVYLSLNSISPFLLPRGNVAAESASVLALVQSDPARLKAFNALYGTSIKASGTPSDNDTAVLSALVAGSSFDLLKFFNDFLKPGTLCAVLRSNATTLANFNKLYGTTMKTTGAPLASDRQLLYKITGDPVFNQVALLAILPKAADLYTALQSNATQLDNFNQLFGTALAAKDAPTSQDLQVLYAVVGDTNYKQTTLLANLPKAASLFVALQSSAVNRTSFNTLYGTSLPNTGGPSIHDYQILFGVVADSKYKEANLLPGLATSAGLCAALQSNAENLVNFNKLFGATLQSSSAPSTNDRQTLFTVATDPTFNQTLFLQILPKATPLWETMVQLNSTSSDLKYFNLLFGTKLSSKTPSLSDRSALMGVAGDPAFNQSVFLPILRKAGHLYAALLANSVKLKNFNTKYETTISKKPLTAAQRALFFNITGDPTYNEKDFLKQL